MYEYISTRQKTALHWRSISALTDFVSAIIIWIDDLLESNVFMENTLQIQSIIKKGYTYVERIIGINKRQYYAWLLYTNSVCFVCLWILYVFIIFANISSANLINIILFQIPCHPSHPSPKETTEYVCYK